jgi:molybdate transport system substrate-binding protein
MSHLHAPLVAVALLAAWPASAAPRARLAVAAAANLRPAIERLGEAFEGARPDVEVAVTYGASGSLHAQITAGAPFDAFFSADRETAAALAATGAAEREVVYAIGALVVWVPHGSPLDVERDGLRALARPEAGKVAIANPATAPYGRAAVEALRTAGAWEAVRPRVVLGESAAQAAQFAHSGAAGAALVPRSLALLPALAGGGRAFPVPEGDHRPIEQAAVVLTRSRSPELARAFLAFARGERGRALLAAAGYGLP